MPKLEHQNMKLTIEPDEIVQCMMEQKSDFRTKKSIDTKKANSELHAVV